MNVESGPRKEKAESQGRREERPELGDECGKLGLAVGARSEKDGLAPSAGGVHTAPPGRAGFAPRKPRGGAFCCRCSELEMLSNSTSLIDLLFHSPVFRFLYSSKWERKR